MKKIPQIDFKDDPALREGIEVVDIQGLFGQELPADHNPYEHHRLNFFSIIMLTGGHATHVVDFEEYDLTRGDCLMISKGQVHRFDQSGQYEGIMVIFTEAFLLRYCSTSAIAEIQMLYNYFISQLMYRVPELNLAYARSFAKEYEIADKATRSHVMGALLTIYLLKLKNAAGSKETGPPNRSMQYFLTFKQKVEHRHQQTRDAKDYANEMAISYKHLNEVCKETVNKTAKAFIDDYVILEIKRYLTTTSLSNKEIAYKCGF